MIQLRDLRHAYAGTTVLDVPAFEARQGEPWLVLGLSGSGKTTLLHVMGGLLRPTAGRVTVAGQDLGALRGAALDRFRGRHIGIVYQQMHLLQTLTVADNLRMAPYLAGLPQDDARVRDVLASLDVAEKADAYPDELSFGQRQRVAIARAVMNRPQVILADEPTSSLDDVRSAQVLELLMEQAARYDATLVVATHDRRIQDRFEHRLVLGDGVVQAADAPA